MVNVCPTESDPRESIDSFLTSTEIRAIAGLRTEGIEGLGAVVRDGILRHEPGSEIVVLDRDALGENGIDFPRDLASFLEGRLSSGRKVNVIVPGDLPVLGWQSALEGMRGRPLQAYSIALACRAVPVCSKLL